MMENVDAVESVTDPCSIAAPPPQVRRAAPQENTGKRLKHCQEIRNRKGARKRTQTRNQSGRRNSPVVAKNFREDLIPWRKEKKFLAREVAAAGGAAQWLGIGASDTDC